MTEEKLPHGQRGGGSVVRRLDVSETAAAYVKRRATISGPRYRKEEANATASAILEALASGALVTLPMTPDLRAALPWLEEARRSCISEDAQRGLDQLIAAVWTATRPADH